MALKLLRGQRQIQRLALRRFAGLERDIKLLTERLVGLRVTPPLDSHHIERRGIDVDHNGLIPLDRPRIPPNLALHEAVPIVEHFRRLRRHFDLDVVLIRREKGELLKQRLPALHRFPVSPFLRFLPLGS